MLNLYTNSIDQNGFMALVSKSHTSESDLTQKDNRKIIATFALVSLTILSVIADTAVLQLQGFDFVKTAEVISAYSIV